MARENKEKTGKVKRFSIRLPIYQHQWLKSRSISTKGTDNFISINKIIEEAIEEYIGLSK